MYIVLVGPSGVRKGTALKPGCTMLKEISGIYLAAESITREALIRSLRRTTGNIVDPETGNVQAHSALTIYSEELTVFLGYNNLQLISDLTDWYDCGKGRYGEWTYETKSQGTDNIVGIWVNLIGATTPDLVASALPRDTIGGGLSSRIVFVYEEKKGKSIPFPFMTEEEEAIGRALQDRLEDFMLVTGEFKFNNDFAKLYEKWYKRQEIHKPFNDPKFDGYFQRRPAHLLKLSIIMNVSRGGYDNKILTPVDFNRAIDLLERTEIKMSRTFSAVGKNEDVDILSKIMYDIAARKKMTLTELMQKYYSDVDKERLQKIISTLELMQYVTVKITDTEEYIIYKE